MIIAIFSILILTCVVWTINKIFSLEVCPICAGVALTWLWMIFGMGLGFLAVSRYEFIIAILMGASIGGIVTEIKKIFLKIRRKPNLERVESLEDKFKDCC